MPIVKCECKECKFYDDKLCCCADIVELKTYGQCVEGIKVELNKAIEQQRMAMNLAIQEQMAAVVPYYNYNIHLGGKDM